MNAAPALSMLMAALLVGAALGGLAVWAWAPPRRRLPPLPGEWPLAARRVLNANERRVYNQLRLAFPKYIVMPKLPLVRLCQPETPDQVKFWYELIGAAHVTFAVCNPSGHVLLVIDLDSTRSHSRRSTQIKASVLAACGIQRLHCVADDLPSVDELRLLIQDLRVEGPARASASVPVSEAVGPLMPERPSAPAPAPAMPAAQPLAMSASPSDQASAALDTDRPATWQDPSVFLDSFFTGDDRPDSVPGSESALELPDWPPVTGSRDPADGAIVSDDEADTRWRHAPVRLVGGR